MKALILALLFIASISSPAAAWWEIKYDTTEIKWPNGDLKERWTSYWNTGNENGFIRNGQYSSWYSSGRLHQQGEYLDGKKHFTWTEWYEDGQMAEQISYRHGLRQGLNVAWHPNHDIKYIAHYKDDALHGLYLSRKIPYEPNNPDLSVVDQKFYLYGQLITTYYEGGKFFHLAGPYYCEDSGLWIETSSDFNQFAVGDKIDGQKHGKWVVWDAEGGVINTEWYDKGQLIEMK